MPSDALLTQTAPGTKTSTFSTAGVALGKSKILYDLYMRMVYSAAQNGSGANAWTFDVDLSLDGGSTWSEISGAPPINLTTSAQAGELFLELPLNMPAINATMSNAPQVRLTGTLSGAGSGATITITSVEIVPSSI